MKRQQFRVRVLDKGIESWKDVTGYPVEIVGYPKLDLFVHNTLDHDLLSIPTAWTVSEVHTGFSIVSFSPSMKQAIVDARIRLEKESEDKWLKRIAEVLAIHTGKHPEHVPYCEAI